MKAAVLFLALAAAPVAAQYPTRPPAPMPLAPTKFPPFQTVKLANGLDLMVVENHEHPVISLRLVLPAGSRFDPAGKDGLAELTAELLTKGTATRSADQIAAAIEGVGASLSASTTNDVMNLETDVLTDHVALALQLMGDVVRTSTFPSDEVTLARTRALSAVRLETSQPAAIAARVFSAAAYGNHPYGRHPSEASVTALDQQAVKDFAAARLRPGGSLLVISGDITLAKARQLATKEFGAWTGTAAAAAVSPATPAAQASSITLVHRPGSVQSDIIVGNLAGRPGDPDWYALTVLNKVLGGGTDARLFQIIREQKSWTYDAHSSVTRPREMGVFSAGTETRTAVTDSAVAEILKQLRRLRTEPVSDAEIVAAKGFLVGVFPLSIETPQQVAAQAANVRLLGLSADYLATYRQRVQAVTAAAVRRAATKFVRPDSAIIVVVGDGTALYEKLAAIAPVHIVDPDGKALTPADLRPKAAAIAWDTTQIVARRDSFVVMVQGQPFPGAYWIRALSSAVTNGKPTLTYQSTLGLGQAGSVQGTALIDRATLRGVKTDMSGSSPRGASEVHLTWGTDGHITGNVNVPRQAGPRVATVDTTVGPMVMDESIVTSMIEALPFAPDASFTVAQYNSSSGAVETITLKVSDGGPVTVPAGAFDTWKVTTVGGEGAFVYYVAKAPRRLVKREIVGQPVSFELAK